MKHIPVLLNAVMNALGNIYNKDIVDCTFGAGGYSRAFLEAGANVTAFDRDPNVINDAKQMTKEYGNRFRFISDSFSNISGLDKTVDAIVFDLGISSMQIDIPERGFSFRVDAPLDMRMSANGQTAADLIQSVSVDELVKILRDYGDVSRARPIANALKEKLPQTTFELRNLIFNPRDVAPVFQALRIAVNDEMGELERALNTVPRILKPDGKCICVTFHSVEDRIVKNVFRDWVTVPGDPRLPESGVAPFALIRATTPSEAEVKSNPRARSAHMRGVVKLY